MNKDSLIILTKLLDEKTTEYNVRTLAQATAIDYKNTYLAVKALEKEGILVIKKFGRANTITSIPSSHPHIYTAEHQRTQRFLKKHSALASALQYFNQLPTRFYTLLVFGSYAKRTENNRSDIDLLFIVSDKIAESIEKTIQNIASTTPLKLHIHVFSEKDFKAMALSKERTVGSEAIQHNIILHGIEQYYELL